MVSKGSSIQFREIVQPWLLTDAQPEPCPEIQQGIYIYGAGELGALGLDYCEACDIPVMGILDRTRSGHLHSSSGRDYAIISPGSAAEHDMRNSPVAVAIATLPFGPIREQLHEMGWKSVFPFYNLTAVPRKGHPLRNGWSLGEVSEYEVQTVDWLCRQWTDEKSWRHYEEFLAWHRDNSEFYGSLYPVELHQRYVIPELREALAPRMRQFVDVGSHRGESVHRLTSARLCFEEYVLIEPDPASRRFLSVNLRRLLSPDASVVVLPHVLGEANRMTRFQEALGYCSQQWAESHRERRMLMIDELDLQPDLLKIHTEGTEYPILLGAKETILRSRPCLVFSVYHRREGFCEDIARPMKMFPGYRWYFRLHSHQGTGAFVYAIPEVS